MSSEPTPQQPSQRTSIHDRRLTRQQTKPNRSQVRAAQTRAAQRSVASTSEAPVAAESAATAPVAATPQAKRTAAQRRALERGGTGRGTGMPVGVSSLTRTQEMGMIREDLHLLLLIAGGLLVGMIVLLFFVD